MESNAMFSNDCDDMATTASHASRAACRFKWAASGVASRQLTVWTNADVAKCWNLACAAARNVSATSRNAFDGSYSDCSINENFD